MELHRVCRDDKPLALQSTLDFVELKKSSEAGNFMSTSLL
jgi:hypothetical protein